MKSAQLTSSVLMVRPASFRSNEETAINNYFQHKSDTDQKGGLVDIARAEFDNFVSELERNKIQVVVVDDIAENDTPDALFPNNWISFHENGKAVLYPMFAPNRRRERRIDVLSILHRKGFDYAIHADYSQYENQDRFLEGTGSLVFDRENKIAYCAISPRADHELFLQFCKDQNYIPIAFHSRQQVNNEWLPIYHTNVLMSVATNFAVVCLEAIRDSRERELLIASLIKTNKEIIEISAIQMHRFTGNLLALKSPDGKTLLVMSQCAHDALNQLQKERLSAYAKFVVVNIPTIEKHGGGSARCMMAELF